MKIASYDGKTGTIHMTNGMQVSHNIKINESMNIDSYGKPDSLPLQMMIRVGYKDAYVMTWGAETEQDNAEMAIWWRRAKNNAQNIDSERMNDDSRDGYNLLMAGLS